MQRPKKSFRQRICPYSLRGVNLQDESKIKIYLEKKGDRITIILKGDADEKLRQKGIVKEILRSKKVKVFTELFHDVYEVIFQRNSFSGIDDLMAHLRKQNIITHHAYNPQGEKSTLYNLTDRIMISFIENVSDDKIEQLLDVYKLKFLYKFNSLIKARNTIVVEVTDQSGAKPTTGVIPTRGKNPAKIADLLEKEKIVDIAEVSLIYRLPNPLVDKQSEKEIQQEKIKVSSPGGEKALNETFKPGNEEDLTMQGIKGKGKSFIPNDTLFKDQWHLKALPSSNGDFIIKKGADVNAEEAWKILEGGGDKEIIIAIIDTQIDFNHPDLKNQLFKPIEEIKKKFVFIPSDNVIPDALLVTGDHGTMCAGVALAQENGSGVVGIAYGCRFLPVWLKGDGSIDMKVKCFEEVGKVADVISFSASPKPEHMIGKTLVEKLTEIATFGGRRGRGCVICVSAGNYQVPLNKKLVEELKYFDENGNSELLPENATIINLYAAHPDVIAVTASTSLNTKASYNNFGKEISVCAPSADWDLQKGTTKLTTAGIYTTSGNGKLNNGLYSDEFCGTSAATPLVAGIAALVLSANNDLPAQIVKKILEVTADKINPADAKYDNNGHSEYYGYGKVNAGKAVQLAANLKMKNGGNNSITIETYKQQIKEIMGV